jgi:hypothetical protein
MTKTKLSISVVVLLMAACASFAFRGKEAKNRAALTCTWYNFTGALGEEFDPTKYVLTVGLPPSCPGDGPVVCGICVDPSDIYGSTEAFPGLPKVDNSETAIANVVVQSVVTEQDNYQPEYFNEACETTNP